MPWRTTAFCRTDWPAAFSDRLIVDSACVDFAARQMALQELVHLLELQVVIGMDGDLRLFPLDLRLRVS